VCVGFLWIGGGKVVCILGKLWLTNVKVLKQSSIKGRQSSYFVCLKFEGHIEQMFVSSF
jgi:hypothetical protein